MNNTLMTFLLLSVFVWPLMLALALMLPSSRRFILPLAPWAALPALILSLWMPTGTVLELPWLLLGSHLAFDVTARVFLFFSSLLWLIAGIYSVGYFSEPLLRARFFIWFLLAMAGNLGLILAHDLVLFYTLFTLMSFASYGLVVFDRSQEALRAGRVYIVLVVLGEVMLFAAFVLAAWAAGGIEFASVQAALAAAVSSNWIIGLVFLGFGIKAGVIGLHVWLPLAHPVAPVPASAVLSGAMISAGVLGWLRVLPLGDVALPGWGGVMIVAGMAAVFYAVFVGLLQRNAKTVLAYSSVSCMGVMTIAVGLGLVAPGSWSLIVLALLIYALQHGLAKGALFLSVDMSAVSPVSKGRYYLLIAGLLLPVLSLAGAPLTSGMIAKHLLHLQVNAVDSPLAGWLQMLMPWSSVAISMLMGHFLILVWPRGQRSSVRVFKSTGMWLSWSVLFVVVMLSPWFIPFFELKGFWSLMIMISAFWPLVLGGGLALIIHGYLKRRQMPRRLRIPPGDVLIVLEDWILPGLKSFLIFCRALLEKAWLWLRAKLDGRRGYLILMSFLAALENRLWRWATGATLFLMLSMLFIFLASFPGIYDN